MMQTMVIPYIIILSDSDDEINEPLGTPVYNPYLDSDYEPEEYMDTDDSADEQIVMETPPAPPSPLVSTYDRSGPSTIRVPHKSVANSCHRQNPLPTPVVPPVAPVSDPYRNPFEDNAVVGHIRETLQDWRKVHHIPSTHEIGESSSASSYNPVTGESTHDTIPLLVARAARQDDQLDLIEGVIMDLPLNDMKEQIDAVEEQVNTAKGEVGELIERNTQRDEEMKVVKERLDGFEARVELLDTMVTTMKEIVTQLLKKQSGPK